MANQSNVQSSILINEEPDLDSYYRAFVIGGTGAFCVPAHDYRDFREAIRDFAAAGVIVLLATHDFDEMHAVCDTVGFIDHGLVAYGPVATTFTAERLRETFGGQVAVIS